MQMTEGERHRARLAAVDAGEFVRAAANDNEPAEPDYWPLGRAYARGLLGDAETSARVMEGVRFYRRAAEDRDTDALATPEAWLPQRNGAGFVSRNRESLFGLEHTAHRHGALRTLWRLLGNVARPFHRVVVERVELAHAAPVGTPGRFRAKAGAVVVREAGLLCADVADADAWESHYGTIPPWRPSGIDGDRMRLRVANDVGELKRTA